MLSSVAERTLLRVRASLAIGWLVLIVSLFWDPLTPLWTDPGHLHSPFRVNPQHTVLVQDQPIADADRAYPMGNRLFWTMLVPIVPLFLMVAGHEAWRRVCPLSWWSQLPRRLGWQRQQRKLNRRTGEIESHTALPDRDGWWRRHALMIQFALLVLGLNVRLWFVNADRWALAIFLLFIIGAAIAVGFWWGGKVWCNNVCPVAVVQRVYTGPGGLLESKAHLSTSATPQSVCRRPAEVVGLPDVNRCVGCTPSCPDTDVEKSYWESVQAPQVRWVHYGLIGLIWGFYGYYYAYAGHWDYYFSGIWTRETTTWQTLTGPGFAAGGVWGAIPKWLAVPLFLGGAVGVAMLLGHGIERAILRLGPRWWPRLDELTLQHRWLVCCAWLAINSFYLFGGRPNLLLLPVPVLRVVEVCIVALTTMWLVRSWQRQRSHYRKESRAVQWRRQLEAYPLVFQRALEGRLPAELTADEADVLARTLPVQTANSQREAFRQALAVAVEQHQMHSPETRLQLEELRLRWHISEEEQTACLAELGWLGDVTHDDFSAVADNWLRLDNHRVACEAVVLPMWQPGQHLSSWMRTEPLHQRLESLREAFGLSLAEHQHTLSMLSGPAGSMAEMAQRQLDDIADLSLGQWRLRQACETPPPQPDRAWPERVRQCAQAIDIGLQGLVMDKLNDCLARLAALDDHDHSRRVAADLASVLPEATLLQGLEHLTRVGGVLPPAVRQVWVSGYSATGEVTAWAHRWAQSSSDDLDTQAQGLLRLVEHDPWLSDLLRWLLRQWAWPVVWHAPNAEATSLAWRSALAQRSIDVADPPPPQPHQGQALELLHPLDDHIDRCVAMRLTPALAHVSWRDLDRLAQGQLDDAGR